MIDTFEKIKITRCRGISVAAFSDRIELYAETGGAISVFAVTGGEVENLGTLYYADSILCAGGEVRYAVHSGALKEL